MNEKIENVNVETEKGGLSENKVNTYNPIEGEEFGKKETEDYRQQAEKLITEIQGEKSSETKSEVKKDGYILNPEIQTAIDKSNRPEEVKKGIQESYRNIDTTIKESKNEKGIAGFLGKIMNKILDQ